MTQLELDFDMSSTYIYNIPSAPTGNVTISTSNTGYNGSWVTTGASNTAFGYSALGSQGVAVSKESTLEIKGENADILINGKSMVKFMEAMENRLAILQPDLEKLEHFTALKRAYDHYKALEALCELPKKEDDNS